MNERGARNARRRLAQKRGFQSFNSAVLSGKRQIIDPFPFPI